MTRQTSDTWRGCAQAGSGNYEKGRALGINAIIPPRDPQEKAQSKQASAAAIYQAPTLRIRPHHLLCMSCFHGGKDKKLAPIAEDNLFEAIDVIQKQPDIPVTLIAGVCMICPPCGKYDPANKLCVGGHSMALRDQKKDLDVLQKLGLKYGDTLPARQLFQLLYERILSTREICGYGDGEVRAGNGASAAARRRTTPIRRPARRGWESRGSARRFNLYASAAETRLVRAPNGFSCHLSWRLRCHVLCGTATCRPCPPHTRPAVGRATPKSVLREGHTNTKKTRLLAAPTGVPAVGRAVWNIQATLKSAVEQRLRRGRLVATARTTSGACGRRRHGQCGTRWQQGDFAVEPT